MSYNELFANSPKNLSTSLDCLLDFKDESELTQNLFYSQLLGIGLTLSLLFLLWISYPIYRYLKMRNTKNIKEIFISIFLSFLITVQPGIIEYSLTNSLCKKVKKYTPPPYIFILLLNIGRRYILFKYALKYKMLRRFPFKNFNTLLLLPLHHSNNNNSSNNPAGSNNAK